MAAARLGWPRPGCSALLLCDLQERFRGSVAAFPHIVAVAARLLQGCRILGVPALVTEQRPEVLGRTVPELGAQDVPRVPKTAFSMAGAAAPLLREPALRHVLLCGIEAHACVLQTALDLLEQGLDVHVVADAVSSRSQVDRALALARMRQAGAHLSTCESLLLLLLRDSAHPKFRQILPLIKEPPPDTGLILGGPLGVLGGP
ncbi:isochorismatase domain-containing protein 2 [Camarhynchus parvulus]|uniref:isochorismatase domain-containing protein 2 n=1 Tax=Geospiza parvula TaxID=87175 RepID=UPI001237F19F|nr:isochorismatase domain-containing protein 2 [Camarhynchus parvulus]XP_030826511.1 isochorismatase domain-containing protein 2 [Camarhynchus parvulus]XP_030826512.1 isochorismatase domain-containing protein 2 [Camarhynchus parvulus]XP_030826514.1 isochorismatase domain-containing protein 2 [Camarhynchus parvulus]XP_030826515.1 isochorismatase domain-containing protein 2 [Camarhynchus parvulus]XP_030826516.1 isochorismatase domain-containing protein 2 [Camarhynchus parvulus]XP_030826517.1 is